jgi:ADP-heptose:LPS heptosyltransferase
MKILFVQIAGLGDLVLCEPMLHWLRATNPGVSIYGWFKNEHVLLAKACGLADELVWSDAVKEGYDLAVMCSNSDKAPTRLLNAKAVVMSKATMTSDVGIAEQRVRGLIQALNLTVEVPKEECVPRLTVPKAAGAEGYIAVHVCGKPGKEWGIKNWVELGKRLIGAGNKLLIIGGREDGNGPTMMAASLPVAATLLSMYRNWPEVAGLMANCKGFVGAESGPTHVAAALGLPVVAMWRRNTVAYRPIGARHVFIERDALEVVTVDTVAGAVERGAWSAKPI